MAKKFKQYAANMGMIIKNVSVKVHHSIKMVEHYYKPLQQVYSIINTKILDIKPNLALQMFFKAINNLINPNMLVFILLVFSAYPRMSKQDAPSLSIIYYVMVLQKAMDKVQRCTASQ